MSMETKFFELEKKLFPRLPEISSKVDAAAIYNLEPTTNRLLFCVLLYFHNQKKQLQNRYFNNANK